MRHSVPDSHRASDALVGTTRRDPGMKWGAMYATAVAGALSVQRTNLLGGGSGSPSAELQQRCLSLSGCLTATIKSIST